MLFAITWEKVDQKLQVVTAKIRSNKEENQAKIAVLYTPATAVVKVTST